MPGTEQDPEYERGKKFTVHMERQRYLARKYLHNNMCGTLHLELYKMRPGIVKNAFNPSTQMQRQVDPLSLRPAWSIP